METVNQRNNEPQLFPGGEETLAGLVAMCREKMWPLLKNSTCISYDYHLDTYILPKWGPTKLSDVLASFECVWKHLAMTQEARAVP